MSLEEKLSQGLTNSELFGHCVDDVQTTELEDLGEFHATKAIRLVAPT